MRRVVNNLWIGLVKTVGDCGQAVQKLVFIHTAKVVIVGSTHFLLNEYTAFVNNFFNKFTEVKINLFTSSTWPTKTIYLNKKEILI